MALLLATLTCLSPTRGLAQAVNLADVPAVTRLAPIGVTEVGAPARAAQAEPPAAQRQPDANPPATPAPQRPAAAPPERELSPFEQLATQANGGKPVLRLGTEPRPPAPANAPARRVPSDYVLQQGDELGISVWGSLEGQWSLRIDRAGRITLPRVGPVLVAGRSLLELPVLLRQRLDTVFKDYQLSAAVTDPSPVPVHITGFVDKPGDQVLPPLSTITSAIARSVGPASAGSLRRVRLLRDDRSVVEFDLYQLLRTGSRRDDRLLQPGDVLHVEAAGAQVAVLGSVNRAAVLEILPGETVGDALRLAGGLSPVADRGVLLLERMGQRHTRGAVELQLPRDLALPLEDGDLLRAGASALVDGPTQLRNKRVRISGEVLHPGDYLLPPGAQLDDALAAAGGATPSALLYGTALRRESVRRLQEQNYQRALRELETSLLEDAGRGVSTDGANGNANAARDLLTRLRERQPEGRMVLELAPDASALPPVPLEDGDQIHVPPRSQTVGVFGSVYNPGSFLHVPGRHVQDYLQRAGGPRERAKSDAIFVVRANGDVVTGDTQWLRSGRLDTLPALPGDTVFVPERLATSRFVQDAKDWTQVLYQLGLGVAALVAVR
jgi:protein involved in polysaccharide export with SLBB domain